MPHARGSPRLRGLPTDAETRGRHWTRNLYVIECLRVHCQVHVFPTQRVSYHLRLRVLSRPTTPLDSDPIGVQDSWLAARPSISVELPRSFNLALAFHGRAIKPEALMRCLTTCATRPKRITCGASQTCQCVGRPAPHRGATWATAPPHEARTRQDG